MSRPPETSKLMRIDRRDLLLRVGSGALASAGAGLLPCPPLASQTTGGLRMGLVHRRPAAYFTRLDDDLVRCDLCPHRCRIEAGQRGLCGVRESGGGELHYIPALNARYDHVAFLSRLIEKHIAGWPESSPDWSASETAQALDKTRQRAIAHGATR